MSLKQFVFGAVMLFSISAFAQQTQPAGIASKEIPKDAQALEMAGRLIKYGYQTKSALPLIQAVEIFKMYNVCEVTPETPKVQGGNDIGSNITKVDAVSFDERQLLADATKFADGNKTLMALIQDADKTTRGVTPKRKEIKDKVPAGRYDLWKFTFRGEEIAVVNVIGDGDSDLDIYIYDEDGNLIECDEEPGDNCLCTFTPLQTGIYTIKIVNLGRVYNNYVLLTN